MYREKFKKFLIFAVIGALIGFLVGLENWDGAWGMLWLFIWAGAGAASGWVALEKVFGRYFFIGNPIYVIVAYCFRFGFSLGVGLFAFPVRLFYYISKIRQEEIK